MVKKKIVKLMIPASYVTEAIKVPIKILILGKVVNDLKGLINLIVLKPLMPFMEGISVISDVTTTMKSIQFQLSVKYVLLPNKKP